MIATSPLLARLDFSHTSEDGDTVYFKVAIQNLKNTMFDFEASLKTYRRTKDTQKINGRGERQFGIMPVTRIGTEPNNTYMTDIALPALRMHRDTEHISFQWKELFAPIYQEEYRISVHKAAHDITSPSMMTLPTKFPIVIAAEFLHYHQRNGTEDSWIRTEVQRPRYRHLAPPDERPYGFASRKTFLFWKNIDDQLRNLEQYRDSVRLKELIAARGLRWIEIEGGWGWAEVPDF
ncbi:hypothetical protein N0V86_000457 [Didymella sp. IMI 355093]|nr:hypothetical protein N0V86_000457 [Didymella sp. IMI 355093]